MPSDDNDIDIPDAADESIPSSVKYAHYEAEKAKKEAGEFVPIAELEELATEWDKRYNEHAEYGPADMYANELRGLIANHQEGDDVE